MLGIVLSPPSARAFQALLNNVAMGAFNLSRANGQAALDGVLVVELVWSAIEVAVTLPHRGFTILYRGRFKMRFQLLQYCVGLIRFEPAFLLIHPRFLFLSVPDDGFSRCTEVVTGMEEIDQVAALRTKFLLHLIGYPGCAIAHAMDGRSCSKSGLHRTVKQALPSSANIAL